MAEAVIADGSAYAKCKEMFAAQGGDTRVLDDYNLFEKPAASYELLAEEDGYIVTNDAEKIGSASVLLGAGRQKKGDPLDSPPASPSTRSAATTSARARASPPSTARRISSTLPPPSTAAASSTAPKSPRKPRWSTPSSPRTAWSGTEIPESLRTAPGSVCPGAVFPPKLRFVVDKTGRRADFVDVLPEM